MAQAMTLYDAAFAVLTRELRQGRTAATTKVSLIGGFASSVFIPLTQLLVIQVGWRHSLEILAAFNLLLTAPAHAFVLKNRGTGRHSNVEPAVPLRDVAGEIVLEPAFWALGLTEDRTRSSVQKVRNPLASRAATTEVLTLGSGPIDLG